MSNPLSVAALATFPLGPGMGTDNLTSLPNNQAKGLGAVGTTLQQYFDDNVAPIQIKSGASSVSSTGAVSFFLVCSEDNSHWSNGINPNATTDQSAFLTGLPLIAPAMSMTANATTYTFVEFSVFSLLGFMPSYWAIVVYNQSGAAFDATNTNHIAKHSLISYA